MIRWKRMTANLTRKLRKHLRSYFHVIHTLSLRSRLLSGQSSVLLQESPRHTGNGWCEGLNVMRNNGIAHVFLVQRIMTFLQIRNPSLERDKPTWNCCRRHTCNRTTVSESLLISRSCNMFFSCISSSLLRNTYKIESIIYSVCLHSLRTRSFSIVSSMIQHSSSPSCVAQLRTLQVRAQWVALICESRPESLTISDPACSFCLTVFFWGFVLSHEFCSVKLMSLLSTQWTRASRPIFQYGFMQQRWIVKTHSKSILQMWYGRLPIRKKYIRALRKGTLVWENGQVKLPPIAIASYDESKNGPYKGKLTQLRSPRIWFKD